MSKKLKITIAGLFISSPAIAILALAFWDGKWREVLISLFIIIFTFAFIGIVILLAKWASR